VQPATAMSSVARSLAVLALAAVTVAAPQGSWAGTHVAPRPAARPLYKTKRVRLLSKLGDRISRLRGPTRRVPYFSAAERTAYEVTVQGGRLYWRGKLLDTEHPVEGAPKATFIFVMAKDGTLYAAPNGGTAQNIHHSSFLAGHPAAAAGTLVVVDGVVQRITNKSGHYGHRAGKMRQVLAELERRGIDTEHIDTSFKKRPGKIAKTMTALFTRVRVALHLAPREE
jgi:hypothetical protein